MTDEEWIALHAQNMKKYKSRLLALYAIIGTAVCTGLVLLLKNL